jgi:GT2 family glycosyltransferase
MVTRTEVKNSNTLWIVIVNYRTAALTIDGLHSLENEVKELGTVKVFIVDNASGDDSVEQIQQAISQNIWGDWASLIPSEKNGGFAFGNNLVIQKALHTSDSPQYLLLLNPDTIVRPQALIHLLDFMNANPSVGIAGSRLEDPDGTPQRSAFRFHSFLSEWDAGLRLGIISSLLRPWIVARPVPDQACQTDWVAGASMIIRREVFETVGLMDEDYFMYYEEVDFCLQASKKGWPCWYVPASRVVHLVGQSSGVNQPGVERKRQPTYWFESRRRYFVKNYGLLYAILVDFLWLTGFLSWRGRIFFQRKPDSSPPYFLTDFVHNSVLTRLGSNINV